MKRIKTLTNRTMKNTMVKGGCGECQTSKRIILALIAAMTLCSLVQAKNRTVTENDSLGNKKRVIELRDTTIDGKTVTDTLSIMTYEGYIDRLGNTLL